MNTDLLIKDFVLNHSSCVIMKRAVILPLNFYDSINQTFSIDVTNRLSQIINKKYIIGYDINKNNAILQTICTFVILKNNEPIYFENYDNMYKYETKKYYYPIYWFYSKQRDRYECFSYKGKDKPLLFDYKNFWWRLNLIKAKKLINDKIY